MWYNSPRMKRIGIIGAGRFGSVLAESLCEAGVEVTVVDRDRTAVRNLMELGARAVEGDATQARTLEDAGFAECDVAVVAVGSNIEVSTMATANCKEIGVPSVVSKATSELHGKILKRIGADSVIYPDRDSAHRLARTLASKGSIDLLELSEGFTIAEIDVLEDWRGKTLAEADIRRKTGITVLCLRRLADNPEKPREVVMPGPDEMLRPEDKLIVFGSTKQLDELG